VSSSDIYGVFKTTATHRASFRNGHGTAPLIWGYLNTHFLGREYNGWLFADNGPLWKLVSDERVPLAIRITHAFCMDLAYCPASRIAELASACDETGRVCARDQHVNHWPAIAEYLSLYKPRTRELGVGISCTSVSDMWIDWRQTRDKGTPWNLFDALLAEAA
jgi:hypothetical protein